MEANDLNPQPIYLEGPAPTGISCPPLPTETVPVVDRYEPTPWLLQNRPMLALGLFLATCLSTFGAGATFSRCLDNAWPKALSDGALYSFAIMTILLCHEMGHYLQARRYGVRVTLPYFIPVPIPPTGTFGAVIAMEPRRASVREVFDIGITGPLAGLVPTFVFLYLGLPRSEYQPVTHECLALDPPLLVKAIVTSMLGPMPADQFIAYHPFALAGWVGLLVTSINLIPIGQLDGGHILYGMMRSKARPVSIALLLLAIYATIQFWLPHWWLMIGLICFLGTRHPPTADDTVPLGAWRYVLGIATLAFVVIGFTPIPIRVLGP